MTDPRLELLTPQDDHALQKEIELGQRICRHYLAEERFDLSAVDEAFDLWLRDSSENKPSANQIALGLGSLLGEYLRIRHRCRWVVITDNFGCDLGLIAELTGWQLFPRHWVAKRIDPANAGCRIFADMIDLLVRERRIERPETDA